MTSKFSSVKKFKTLTAVNILHVGCMLYLKENLTESDSLDIII